MPDLIACQTDVIEDSTKLVQITFFTFPFAHVHDVSISYSGASDGVPQGCVPGLILFTVYMLPIENIIPQCGMSFDCSLMFIHETSEKTEEFVKPEACFKDTSLK